MTGIAALGPSLKAAGFPREKSLAGFDYTANPNIEPPVIANLATCAWIIKGKPLCLIGTPAPARVTC